ncbi:MAG: hypothetical protein U0401_15535 [Anaerolineae bacterium]
MLAISQDQVFTVEDQLGHYPLLEALIKRRSRRFGRGFRLNGGPLAYESQHAPQPLTLAEEAALAFAAGGVTGYTLAELPYQSGDMPEAGSGNIITHFIGRTVASGDALHLVSLFVINDDGVWLLKRPQDFPRADVPELIKLSRERRLVELYEKSRVRLAERRLDVPRQVPFMPAFNKWSANLPGTTKYQPHNQHTSHNIKLNLTPFSEEFAYFVVDERRNYQPVGLAKFARSKGGHLHDNPQDGRFGTIGFLESWMFEFAAIEQGGILQNLGLMAEALNLGGFPHFAAHPFIWFQTLGFRMEEPRFSRVGGLNPLMAGLMKMLGKDMPVPTAVGLEQDNQVLLKPFCPPYYRNMEEAVLAFVDYKYAAGTGTFRDGGAATAWRDGAAVQAGIPKYSDQTITATIAYCEYVYQRYGRFPANSGPFRTILAYQAHHLDPDFYSRFYRPEAN